MHQTVAYEGTGPEKDEQALKDIRDYLGDPIPHDRYSILESVAAEVEADKAPIDKLHFFLGFVGIKGYPVHAFCRKHCLQAYRNWMANPEGEKPVPTDEKGYPLG